MFLHRFIKNANWRYLLHQWLSVTTRVDHPLLAWLIDHLSIKPFVLQSFHYFPDVFRVVPSLILIIRFSIISKLSWFLSSIAGNTNNWDISHHIEHCTTMFLHQTIENVLDQILRKTAYKTDWPCWWQFILKRYLVRNIISYNLSGELYICIVTTVNWDILRAVYNWSWLRPSQTDRPRQHLEKWEYVNLVFL